MIPTQGTGVKILKDPVYLAAISLAAKDRGFPSVALPIEHAVVYYLKRKLNFSYRFVWPFFYPRPDPAKFPWAREFEAEIIEYPHSMGLAEDLADLCASDILSVKKLSPTLFSPGPGLQVEKKRELYLELFSTLSKLKYEELMEDVGGAIGHPKRLLDECYKLYINEI